jgi:hypothetical protein
VVTLTRDRSALGADEIGPTGGVAAVVGDLGGSRFFGDSGRQSSDVLDCLI